MMKIGSEAWMALIREAAAQLGITVTRRQAEQFSRHARLLLEWNRKINLTAITDAREVAIKHFVDAIAPTAHIPRKGRLLDIGTGGGFPGIPLKIMRPDQNMTLIDSVRKKVNFVRHVIRQMQLDDIEALHTRAETLADAGPAVSLFDVIVCRALSDPGSALSLARPLLAPGGTIVLYQGPGSKDEGDGGLREPFRAEGSDYHLTAFTYSLPRSDFIRRAILIQM